MNKSHVTAPEEFDMDLEESDDQVMNISSLDFLGENLRNQRMVPYQTINSLTTSAKMATQEALTFIRMEHGITTTNFTTSSLGANILKGAQNHEVLCQVEQHQGETFKEKFMTLTTPSKRYNIRIHLVAPLEPRLEGKGEVVITKVQPTANANLILEELYGHYKGQSWGEVTKQEPTVWITEAKSPTFSLNHGCTKYCCCPEHCQLVHKHKI